MAIDFIFRAQPYHIVADIIQFASANKRTDYFWMRRFENHAFSTHTLLLPSIEVLYSALRSSKRFSILYSIVMAVLPGFSLACLIEVVALSL